MFRPHQPERLRPDQAVAGGTGLAYTSLSFGVTFAAAVMWEGDCCQHHQCHPAPEIASVEISSTFLDEQGIMNTYTDAGYDVKIQTLCQMLHSLPERQASGNRL